MLWVLLAGAAACSHAAVTLLSTNAWQEPVGSTTTLARRPGCQTLLRHQPCSHAIQACGTLATLAVSHLRCRCKAARGRGAVIVAATGGVPSVAQRTVRAAITAVVAADGATAWLQRALTQAATAAHATGGMAEAGPVTCSRTAAAAASRAAACAAGLLPGLGWCDIARHTRASPPCNTILCARQQPWRFRHTTSRTRQHGGRYKRRILSCARHRSIMMATAAATAITPGVG